MNVQARVMRVTSYLLLLVLIVIILIAAEQFLIPLVWAFIFAFIVLPAARRMEARRFSRPLASILSTLLFMVISTLIMVFLVYQSLHILKNENTLDSWSSETVTMYLDSAQKSLGLSFIDSEDFLSPNSFKNILGWLATKVSGMSESIVILTLIPMYLFFILNYRGLIHRFIDNFYKEKERDLERVKLSFKRAYTSIHEYLMGTAILTGVTAILSYLILLVFGVDYAFFFAVFLAVLNLVPYIGNLLGFVVILLFVWGSKSPEFVIYVGAALYVSNLIQENFLRPILVGDKMEMNAAVVFSAVVIGGMIWGFSGMVLFIPLVGILKAFMDSHPDWKNFSIFFESK